MAYMIKFMAFMSRTQQIYSDILKAVNKKYKFMAYMKKFDKVKNLEQYRKTKIA